MRNTTKNWSRRKFLTSAGATPLVGALASGCTTPPELTIATENIYDYLNVRPFINAAGTYTALTASLMPVEVKAVIAEASKHIVSLSLIHI